MRELDNSYPLEVITKLRGVTHGESLLFRIPHEHQSGLLYNNLAIACLDQSNIRRSYDYTRKMKKLSFPTAHHVYNRLIESHSSSCRNKSILIVLRQMQANGVCPHACIMFSWTSKSATITLNGYQQCSLI